MQTGNKYKIGNLLWVCTHSNKSKRALRYDTIRTAANHTKATNVERAIAYKKNYESVIMVGLIPHMTNFSQ